MDIFNRLDFQLVSDICLTRPHADHSIEQYLMTTESLFTQLHACREFVSNKKILFLGDDDHLSLLISLFFNTKSYVLEIDDRIITNQRIWNKNLKLSNHSIQSYDISKSENDYFASLKNFDGFIVNPPYGSKNKAYGAKLWISKALSVLKDGGFGLIILPINFDLPWSIKNMLEVQKFLTDNNCAVIKIDNNLHTYEDLPDPNLRSSNIWIHYLGDAENIIENISDNRNIYR